MGSVVQLRRKHSPRFPEPELRLLNRLMRSKKIERRGGWVARGEPNGVVIVLADRCLGVWMYWGTRYYFTATEISVGVVIARDVDEAHAVTVAMLGQDPDV